jgi:hypothetical protein
MLGTSISIAVPGVTGADAPLVGKFVCTHSIRRRAPPLLESPEPPNVADKAHRFDQRFGVVRALCPLPELLRCDRSALF